MTIVGSGNWGSAIAKIIGRNVLDREEFDNEVRMWVYQEQVDGKNLTDIINSAPRAARRRAAAAVACKKKLNRSLRAA